ncbi:acyl-coenzyme A thioesterase 5-like [Dunckerocampus dactyliophorus]|uniref:acyl-coenzyme A thioesterase 5-like n=1 Tax=Dunckerocampus dactyliophorus TaxID=161453 RepID=UPI0024057D51|nr:acyl-coenzyme A thioesterase 5-like [Dunckerocampus dactyliophorus]XP_054618454.1 acyl-coenzyme A thioesterase 5-like [Dunckerocampus dactyliophorus]XP_054618456.1 acyl-coenzyme A thioesterase 5-like [Dunckerocampus dactyliophorus]XP_054618457.1 acyl-coenzyme A thioesterase 5-like [Dunckerocampus dactyliophorus]XP_054618458.1 acyl-coenzyme A thioesterase 5-like [Dunckerocampus dactyliophorus]XP_054618459.1 acyl-coenzyme A thioesterase 5-like [Dunckerocampus dactyliophorus]XP_054618460.1 ac
MASSQIHLKILPSVRCLADRLVQMRVEGLAPHKPVELRSRLVDDKGVVFKASALYKADETGLVDVSSAPSLGGSYTGVEPMGLLWSMAPETPHSKVVKKNVLSPTLVEIAAHNGDTGELLACETNERGYMMEGMKRIPVQEGRVRGVLFIPPGKGPFPGIVDLYTLGGGLNEQRASLLANKGFVVLALAYYGYQDLPKKPKNLDLEYFEEAAVYLQNHPEVQGPGIGVISMSHSGALALSMASFFSGITATVCINGCNGNTVIPLHYKDIVMPALRPAIWKIRLTRSWIVDIRNVTPDASLMKNRASLIPIERANCHFLFAVSEDDRNWNSAFFARQAAEILRSHGKESFQVVSYPKAGHFLEVPHTPFCPSSFHAAVGRAVVFGGEPKAHSEAQLDLWERVQEFFKRHLNNTSTS